MTWEITQGSGRRQNALCLLALGAILQPHLVTRENVCFLGFLWTWSLVRRTPQLLSWLLSTPVLEQPHLQIWVSATWQPYIPWLHWSLVIASTQVPFQQTLTQQPSRWLWGCLTTTGIAGSGAEIQTQVLMLFSKALHRPSHLPSPTNAWAFVWFLRLYYYSDGWLTHLPFPEPFPWISWTLL